MIILCLYENILRVIIYVSASRSPPGLGILQLTMYHFGTAFGVNFPTLGSLLEDFGVILHPWGHFWSTLATVFEVKNGLGLQRCPERRHPGNTVAHLDTFWRSFFDTSENFCKKKRVLETHLFFLSGLDQFVGGPTWSWIEPARSKRMWSNSQ